MDAFDLTILSQEDTQDSYLNPILCAGWGEGPISDLALLRGANNGSYFFTTLSNGNDDIITMNRRKDIWQMPKTTRIGGIRLVLVPSNTLYRQLLIKRQMVFQDYDQVVFLEYPQSVVSMEEQFLLKEELCHHKLFPTGKSYTFDGVGLENCYMKKAFEEKKYPEYSYKNQKYIYVDTCINLDRPSSDYVLLSNGYRSHLEEELFVKVEPVLWWIDRKQQRLISYTILLGGIQFQEYGKEYRGNFNGSFLKHYLDTYMKKELIPSNILSKSETFDSSETLQRLVYKKYGKRR